MKIEYFHASKYGNGVTVAVEFKNLMAAKGVTVTVHILSPSPLSKMGHSSASRVRRNGR